MTAPDEAFVAGVIEKLSPSAREAVLDHSSEPRRLAGKGYGRGYASVRAAAIRGKGLFQRRLSRNGWLYSLTDLGLAVREQLLRMESGS